MQQKLQRHGCATIERRSARRIKLITEVDLHHHTNFYVGWTEDISAGGIFVATYSLLEIGTEVELSFTLPTGHEIEVIGEVRWLRDPPHSDDHHADAPPGIGVQFRNLSDGDAQAIKEFIASREPLFFA